MIVQADAVQEPQPPINLFEDLISDGLSPGGEGFPGVLPGGVGVYLPHPFKGFADVLARHIHNSQAAYRDRQSLWPQPLSAADLAGTGRHIAFDLLAGMVGFGFPIAALQVWNNTLEGGVPAIFATAVGLVGDGDLLGFVAIKDYVKMFLVELAHRNFG